MKELTLNVNIQKQGKGVWILRATPQDMDIEPLATYCIGSHRFTCSIESSRYGRKLLVDTRLRFDCLLCRTSHSRRLHRTQSHGKDNRLESSHHPAIALHLGSFDGSGRNDYCLAMHHHPTLLL